MNTEENFNQYKTTESAAIEIAQQLSSQDAKIENCEIALLVAIFEMHKSKGTDPETVRKIIMGHLETIAPFYEQINN